MTALAFIDTETDGLGPHRLAWEVAIIRVDNAGTDQENTTRAEFFIGGFDLSKSDPKALEVGRYWERHPHGRERSGLPARPNEVPVSQEAAARRIFKATHDAILVGSNPAFDAQCFERLLRGAGLLPTWDYRLINVRDMAMGYLLNAGFSIPPDVRTEDLSRRCGVAVPDSAHRHTAMGDAEWVKCWFEKLALSRPGATLGWTTP